MYPVAEAQRGAEQLLQKDRDDVQLRVQALIQERQEAAESTVAAVRRELADCQAALAARDSALLENAKEVS